MEVTLGTECPLQVQRILGTYVGDSNPNHIHDTLYHIDTLDPLGRYCLGEALKLKPQMFKACQNLEMEPKQPKP